MYKYAQIQDGVVWGIMEHEADIDTLYEKYFSKYIEFVDITDTPDVQEGNIYDGVNFSKPPPVIQTPHVDQNIADLWEAYLEVAATLETLKEGGE